jgi:hypothetical protein
MMPASPGNGWVLAVRSAALPKDGTRGLRGRDYPT